jgi:hypothetical protein
MRNSQVWWCKPIIQTLRRQRQKDHKFEIGLGYIVRTCLKTQKKRRKNKCRKKDRKEQREEERKGKRKKGRKEK